MNVLDWQSITGRAIGALMERESRRASIERTSFGDRHGYWVSTYSIAPRNPVATEDLERFVLRYLRMAAPNTPEDGVAEIVEVGVGAEALGRYLFLDVAFVPQAGLDDSLHLAVTVALSIRQGDLTESYNSWAIAGVPPDQQRSRERPEGDRTESEAPRERADQRSLTPQELEVLSLIGRGIATRDLAKRLQVPPETLRSIIGAIAEKRPEAWVAQWLRGRGRTGEEPEAPRPE